MAKLKVSESTHQTAFIDWVRRFKKIRDVTFHVPNGGFRNKREALNLQRQGVLPGVPDIFIAFPIPPFCGLFIEFKAGKNKLTPLQEAMIERLLRNGYQCKVCYSWEAGKQAVEEYLGNKLFDIEQ